MSEFEPKIEQKITPELKNDNRELERRLQEKLEQAANSAEDASERIPELHHTAKQEALPAENIKISEHTPHQPSTLHVNRELKQMTFQRTLKRVRKHLSAPDKTFSKVIHQPTVDTVSRVGEKTLARPSGLLGGGICAFAGSTALLWAAKHYGFRYNYLLFALLFVGGFIFGVTLELVIKLATARRRA